MRTLTKIKLVTAVVLAIFAIGVSCAIVKSSLHAADTQVRNELAIKQMENTKESSALYEEYRNVSNAANALPSVLGIVCGTAGIITLLFIPEIKAKSKSKF